MTQVVSIPNNDDQTKVYHLKKLFELSLKSSGKIPQVDEPTDDQKGWVIRKMKTPNQSWEVWDA